MRNNFELLLPAGSFKALELAIYNGADAVYLGLSNFSARAKAENFNSLELKSAVEFAHLYNKKIYVAVNTLIKTSELSDCLKTIEEAYYAGVDAIIIQSLSLGAIVKKIFPDLDIHVSTQAGIHNTFGAEFIKKLGFSRVILSRETTLEDIKDICQIKDLETEVFVHGAMCTSFSGGCYMSSFISQNSGNRGKCLQPCRLKYTTDDNHSAYLLSLSDMHVGDKVKDLMQLGVKSFKIEGRMRRPEYAGYAARYYDKLLRGIKPDKKEFENLSGLYNRGGFTFGHYFNDENIASIDAQGHTGYTMATAQKSVIIKGIKKLSVKKINTLNTFNDGDGFKIMRDGLEVGSAYFNAKENENLNNEKDKYLLSYSGGVKFGDYINRTTDALLLKEIADYKSFLDVDMKFYAFPNQKALLKVKYRDIEISEYTESEVQVAEREIDKNQIIDRLSKTGDTIFNVKKINVNVNGFIPLKELNAVRRTALENLKSNILEKYHNSIIASRKHNETELIYQVKNLSNQKLAENKSICEISVISDSAAILNDKNISYRIFKPSDYNSINFEKFFSEIDKNYDIYLYLPKIFNGKDAIIIKYLISKYNIKGVFAENIGQIEFAKSLELKVFGGTALNIFSKADEKFYKEHLDDFVASAELSIKEYEGMDCAFYGFGEIQLMALNHCVYKAYSKKTCETCAIKESFYITDRKNIKFEIKRFKLSKCYFNVINNKLLNIFNRQDYLKINKMLIDVTTITQEEAKNLISDLHNKKTIKILKEDNTVYTSGHAYRGVF